MQRENKKLRSWRGSENAQEKEEENSPKGKSWKSEQNAENRAGGTKKKQSQMDRK